MQNVEGWPTGLEPAPFGATIRCHRFLGVALCCRIGLSKPFSLQAVARCFWVLRSEWCQQWCHSSPLFTDDTVPSSAIIPHVLEHVCSEFASAGRACQAPASSFMA